MRELSLHLLDLIENSIRAQASVISVSVEADPKTDTLRLAVEDNGTGLKVTPEEALDPFYTTKSGKRTGLGLSLFREAAERAGGRLSLEKSALGGVAVSVEMRLTHIDRTPLGDLAATLSSVVCTHPEIDFRFRLQSGDRRVEWRVFDLAAKLGIDPHDGLALAQNLIEVIGAELQSSDLLR